MPIYPGNKKNLGNTVNNSGKFKSGLPKFLVMHYTAGGDGLASAEFLFRKHSPGSSAHFVVDRNGDVFQIADTGLVTWHAGVSFWKGYQNLNSSAIGIEIANYGYWRPGISIKTAADAEKKGWLKAKHRNGGPEYLWEPYPEACLKAVDELTKWILQEHPSIREIVGHDDIAPSRKIDPGPLFPMQRYRDIINPRSDGSVIPKDIKEEVQITPEKKTTYKVNATSLNVRGGPGTNFGVVGSLKKGATVNLLNEKDDWSYIKYTSGKSTKEGWVFSMYLTPT